MNAFDRNTNLIIIRDIRNSEKISLDNYIEKVLIPFNEENSTFCEALYKDIVYILNGIDNEENNELMIENGELVIEDGELKLTGYQTRLHDILIWLHIEVIKKFELQSSNPTAFLTKLENFNNRFLTNFNFTPEYKKELDKIKMSIKKERKYNYDNNKSGFSKYLDPDILELKPNIMGLGINLNEIINKLRKK